MSSKPTSPARSPPAGGPMRRASGPAPVAVTSWKQPWITAVPADGASRGSRLRRRIEIPLDIQSRRMKFDGDDYDGVAFLGNLDHFVGPLISVVPRHRQRMTGCGTSSTSPGPRPDLESSMPSLRRYNPGHPVAKPQRPANSSSPAASGSTAPISDGSFDTGCVRRHRPAHQTTKTAVLTVTHRHSFHWNRAAVLRHQRYRDRRRVLTKASA